MWKTGRKEPLIHETSEVIGTPDFTRLPKSCGLTKITIFFSVCTALTLDFGSLGCSGIRPPKSMKKTVNVENREKGAINPRDFGGHGILDFRSLVA